MTHIAVVFSEALPSQLYNQGIGQLILDIEFKLTKEHTIVLTQARPYAAASL